MPGNSPLSIIWHARQFPCHLLQAIFLPDAILSWIHISLAFTVWLVATKPASSNTVVPRDANFFLFMNPLLFPSLKTIDRSTKFLSHDLNQAHDPSGKNLYLVSQIWILTEWKQIEWSFVWHYCLMISNLFSFIFKYYEVPAKFFSSIAIQPYWRSNTKKIVNLWKDNTDDFDR